jgi:hypothetical protein
MFFSLLAISVLLVIYNVSVHSLFVIVFFVFLYLLAFILFNLVYFYLFLALPSWRINRDIIVLEVHASNSIFYPIDFGRVTSFFYFIVLFHSCSLRSLPFAIVEIYRDTFYRIAVYSFDSIGLHIDVRANRRNWK